MVKGIIEKIHTPLGYRNGFVFNTAGYAAYIVSYPPRLDLKNKIKIGQYIVKELKDENLGKATIEYLLTGNHKKLEQVFMDYDEGKQETFVRDQDFGFFKDCIDTYARSRQKKIIDIEQLVVG